MVSTIFLSSLVKVEHVFCPNLIVTFSSNEYNESGFADKRYQQCEINTVYHCILDPSYVLRDVSFIL